MIVNFIKDNRFPKFINKLASNSLNQTDSAYIDDSPNGIFDGDIGTVLVILTIKFLTFLYFCGKV